MGACHAVLNGVAEQKNGYCGMEWVTLVHVSGEAEVYMVLLDGQRHCGLCVVGVDKGKHS